MQNYLCTQNQTTSKDESVHVLKSQLQKPQVNGTLLFSILISWGKQYHVDNVSLSALKNGFTAHRYFSFYVTQTPFPNNGKLGNELTMKSFYL